MILKTEFNIKCIMEINFVFSVCIEFYNKTIFIKLLDFKIIFYCNNKKGEIIFI